MSGTVSQVTGSVADAMGLTTDGVVPVSSRELFWRARYLRASAGLAHLPFLFWLFADHKPRRTVTLNMGEGVLHFAACQAVDKLSLDSLCFGYGEWDGDGVPATIAAYNDEQYDEFSRLEESTSSRAARRQPKGSVDLVVVEGPSAALLETIAAEWGDRISDRGTVLITGCDALDDAGLTALEALEADRPTLRLDHGGGLRVILWGDAAPERLIRLAEAEPSHPAILTVGRIFSRLGALHVNEWTARDKSAWARRLATSLKQSEDKAAALEADGAALQAKLQDATTAAQDANAKAATATEAARRNSEEREKSQEALTAAQKDISRLRQWINSLKSDLSDARESAQADAAMQAKLEADLRAEAAEVTQKLDAAVAETGAARKRVADLKSELEALRTAAEADKTALRTKLSALQEKLESVQADAAQAAKSAGEEIEMLRATAQAQAAKLTQEAKTATRRQAALKEARDAAQAALADTEAALEEAEAAAAEQAQDLAQVQTDLRHARAALAGQRAELAGVRGALMAARAQAADRSALEAAQAEVTALQAELVAARRDTRVLTGAMRAIDAGRLSALQRVQVARDAAETADMAAAETLAQERQRRRTIEGVLDTVDGARVAHILAAKDTSAQVGALQAARTQAEAALVEAQAKAAEERTRQNAAAEARFDELLAQLAVTEERSIERAEDLKRATRDLQEAQADQDPQSVQAELAGLRATVARQREELTRQKQELADAQKDGAASQDVEALVAAHEAETKRLEAALADARSQAAAVRPEPALHVQGPRTDEVEELVSTLQDTQKRYAALLQTYREMEAARDALLTSTSWRVTAPIRQISTALRGGSKPT